MDVNDAVPQAQSVTVIAFKQKDGTGDTSQFALEDLTIPEYLRHTEKPWRILPRSKEGILVEVMLPLFTVFNGDILPHTIHLLQLEAKDGRLGKTGNHGRLLRDYLNALNRKQASNPSILLTTGYRRNGERFGDPHAIYCPDLSLYVNPDEELIQVVAFLSVRAGDQNNQKMLEKIDTRAVPLYWRH